MLFAVQVAMRYQNRTPDAAARLLRLTDANFQKPSRAEYLGYQAAKSAG